MAFRDTEFKKLIRTSGGERRLYPHQLKDDRYTAALRFAVDYYERSVGRPRAELDAAALLEFFGDPKLARGLVACLAQSYRWATPTLRELLGDARADTLASGEIARPADLRARLYTLTNADHDGMLLPEERDPALARLVTQLLPEHPTDAGELLRALYLDAEQERRLERVGPVPTPADLAARYNFQSIDTALRLAERVRLDVADQDALALLRELADAEQLPLLSTDLSATISVPVDPLAGRTRSGRRLARLLTRLLTRHPQALSSGSAKVRIGGSAATLLLEPGLLRVLGGLAKPAGLTAWCPAETEALWRAWGRAYIGGKTGGWRARRDPAPSVTAAGSAQPDLVAIRGQQSVPLWLAASNASALQRRVAALALPHALVIAPEAAGEYGFAAHATPAETVLALTKRLAALVPASQERSPWEQLRRRVQDEGFISAAAAAALLGCTEDQLTERIGRSGADLAVVPEIGVCASAALHELRALLQDRATTGG